MIWKTVKKHLEQLGHLFFYVVLKIGGLRGAYLCLYPVVFTYTLCSKHIRRTTQILFSRLHPGNSSLQLFFDTYKNVYSFGQTLVDRAWLGLEPKAEISATIIGKEKLFEIISSGQGAVLVTAHVGNWQSAMANLGFLPVKVHALMQYDQSAAAKHYFDLGNKERSFDIIDSEGPFGGMVDAAAALQRGEAVTIMADRYVKGTTKAVDFLGKEVRLPDAAYALAASVEAPVIIFLAARTGYKRYELKVWDVFHPKFPSREARHPILQDCCRRFANSLENYLKKYPYQWYNFFDLWEQ